jgi:hypothetical protein
VPEDVRYLSELQIALAAAGLSTLCLAYKGLLSY